MADERKKRDGTLTVILPACNEADNILPAAEAVKTVLTQAGIPCRIFFIDDGSTDGTWEQIERASEEDRRVAGLHFSKNFGKESAVFAGLANAATECCAVMDADLQHPPETLVEMYRLWQNGADVVEGLKAARGRESAAHGGAARLFYALIGRLSGMKLDRTSDFKLLDREVVTVIRHLPERNTFFRAMSFWVGFETASVEYEVRERTFGESKWNAVRLFRYAAGNIASFSTAPMRLIAWLGGLMMAVGLVFGVIALAQKIRGTAVTGFTTVILLMIFFSAMIMLSLGIIGFYIARIYREVQHRPRFIISKTCGVDEGDVRRAG